MELLIGMHWTEMNSPVSQRGCVCCAAREQMLLMAAALAKLPGRVLWRLTPKEIPDKAAIGALNLGNNTKVWVLLRNIINNITLYIFTP